MCLKTVGCVANSVDPDQMSNSAESDFPRLNVWILRIKYDNLLLDREWFSLKRGCIPLWLFCYYVLQTYLVIMVLVEKTPFWKKKKKKKKNMDKLVLTVTAKTMVISI